MLIQPKAAELDLFESAACFADYLHRYLHIFTYVYYNYSIYNNL